MNLDFKKYKFGIMITCISEDGVVDDLDEIKSDIQDGISDVVNDIILERNNVVASNLLCVVEIFDDDGDVE